jgi:hypothetical protein
MEKKQKTINLRLDLYNAVEEVRYLERFRTLNETIDFLINQYKNKSMANNETKIS